MVIYDEYGSIVRDPDTTKGYIEKRLIKVHHEYVVDSPAVTHEEVIAEYPETGGMDVETVIDVPEQGHWVTTDEDGKPLPEFDGNLDGMPWSFDDTWEVGIYIPYTREELEAIEETEREIEEQTRKAQEREEYVDKLPERIEGIEEGVDTSYDGIAELGLVISDIDVTLDDIMDAIAELGQIVEER